MRFRPRTPEYLDPKWLTRWTRGLYTAKVPEARQAVPLIDKRKGRWESAPIPGPWQGLEGRRSRGSRLPDRQRSRTQTRDLFEAPDDPRRDARSGRGRGLRSD